MANTTYSLPVNTAAARERAADAISGIGQHLIGWRTNFNADLVSMIVTGGNLDITFSNPIPLFERQHIRVSL